MSNAQRHIRFLRLLIRVYLHGWYGMCMLTGSGPFGARGACIVETPLKPGDTPLKTALYRHHVKQYHEASCSVATVASVLNAVRDVQGFTGKPLSQHDILGTVRTGHWKQRMAPGGHNGRRGLPLPLLGQVVQASFAAYHIDCAAVETIPMPRRSRPSDKVTTTLRQRLVDFETKGNGLIIAHFNQGAFVPTLTIPHISPVGGFDPATGDVVILDVDPDQQHPYQVGFPTFCQGLSSNYHHVFAPFGYTGGGYVYIRLE